MRFMLPPYSADTDAHEVRLMGLRPLSYDDLNSPDAACRFPTRWATPALMGYELMPEVDLAGRPVSAVVRLTGLVYSRASRKLYHCIDNAWISATQLCGEAYGLFQYTDTMSSDGMYLHTAFCHATPFMIAETLGTQAICIDGLYGCKCTLTSPYDTRPVFLGYLLGGGGALALSALLTLWGVLFARALWLRRRLVAAQVARPAVRGSATRGDGTGTGVDDVASTLAVNMAQSLRIPGTAAPAAAAGAGPNAQRMASHAELGARWVIFVLAGGSATAGSLLLGLAVTIIRDGDPVGMSSTMIAVTIACPLLGIAFVIIGEGIGMVAENRYLVGADVRKQSSRLAVAAHLMGVALLALGSGLLLYPTPRTKDTQLFSGLDVWIWVPLLQLIVHSCVHFLVQSTTARAWVAWVAALVRIGTIAPLLFYLVRVTCGTEYRD